MKKLLFSSDSGYLCNVTLFKFQLLLVLVLLVIMVNGVTEDVIEKVAGKKLSEIVELK